MRKIILVLAFLLFPIVASAQSYPPPPPPDGAQDVETAPPPDTEPGAPPPAPAYNGYAQQAAPAGQWVFTPQYGWVWMPYGQQYLDDGGYGARQYVYSVRFGWSWVAAPWLRGPAVHLWFGHLGPSRFGWYRGYGGYRGYRGYFRGGGGGSHRAVPIYRGRSRR